MMSYRGVRPDLASTRSRCICSVVRTRSYVISFTNGNSCLNASRTGFAASSCSSSATTILPSFFATSVSAAWRRSA